MNEAAIEKQCVKLAEDAGWFVRKVTWPGRRGAPDRVFIKDGQTVWVEFKDPDGRLAELQKREIAKMQAAGAKVHVFCTVRDFRNVMGV